MYTLDFFFLCVISFLCLCLFMAGMPFTGPKTKTFTFISFCVLCLLMAGMPFAGPKTKNIYFCFCLLFRFAPQKRPLSAGAFCVRSATEWPAFSRLRKCLHLPASRGGPPVPNKITQNVSYCIMPAFVFNKCSLH